MIDPEGETGIDATAQTPLRNAVSQAQAQILEKVKRWRSDTNWGIFFQNILRNNSDLSDLEQLASTLREGNFKNHSPTGILTAFTFAAKDALEKSSGGQKETVAAKVRAATIAVLGIYSEAAADESGRAAACAIGTVKGMEFMNKSGLLEDSAVKEKAVQTLQGFTANPAFQHEYRKKTIIEPARTLLARLVPPAPPGTPGT